MPDIGLTARTSGRIVQCLDAQREQRHRRQPPCRVVAAFYQPAADEYPGLIRIESFRVSNRVQEMPDRRAIDLQSHKTQRRPDQFGKQPRRVIEAELDRGVDLRAVRLQRTLHPAPRRRRGAAGQCIVVIAYQLGEQAGDRRRMRDATRLQHTGERAAALLIDRVDRVVRHVLRQHGHEWRLGFDAGVETLQSVQQHPVARQDDRHAVQHPLAGAHCLRIAGNGSLVASAGRAFHRQEAGGALRGDQHDAEAGLPLPRLLDLDNLTQRRTCGAGVVEVVVLLRHQGSSIARRGSLRAVSGSWHTQSVLQTPAFVAKMSPNLPKRKAKSLEKAILFLLKRTAIPTYATLPAITSCKIL